MYDIESFEAYTNYQNENDKVCNIMMVGVGGAGCNAVLRLMYSDITCANFVAVNTDAQALLDIRRTALERKPNVRVRLLQIGKKNTGGQGAGADPSVGQKAAEESEEEITNMLKGVQLCFIVAGMGGGTGTGAAPVIARIAKNMDILTIGVVTKPFDFEGIPRMRNAENGILELNKYIDSIIVIPNDKLDRTSVNKAFAQADDVLKNAIKGIGDLIATPCLINLDYADVCRIMKNKGFAHIGIGSGEGSDRALDAVRAAVKNALTGTTIENATSMIISYQAGEDFVTKEINDATMLVNEVLKRDAEIIFGLERTPGLGEKMNVIVIATGFKMGSSIKPQREEEGEELEVVEEAQSQPQDNPFGISDDIVPTFISDMRDKKY